MRRRRAGGAGELLIVEIALDHVRALLEAGRRLGVLTDDELDELARWEHDHEELLDELARSRARLGDPRPPGPFG